MDDVNSTPNAFIGKFNQHIVHNTLGLLVIASTILFFLNYSINRRNKLKKLPPGPTGIPIFGYLPFLGKKLHISLNDLSKRYGKIFGFYLGPKYVVICNDWEAKKEVFSKTAISNRPPGLFDLLPKGFGFSGSNGQEWSEQRKFSMKTIKDIGLGKPMWEEMLQKEVNETIKYIERSEGKPISVDNVFSCSFTNSVLALLLGHGLPFNDPIMKFLSECMHMIMIAFHPMSLPTFMPTFGAFLAKLGLYGSKEIVHKIWKFDEYIENIIKDKLQKEEDSSEMSFVKIYNEAVENNKKRNLNNTFTETSLYANSAALLLGGGDTTRDSTIWLLIAMAQFSDVQSKVQEELDNVIGKEGSIKWSERNTIPYTYAAILEGLRWKTTAPVNALRMAAEDIEVLGYQIPKGTYISANNWAIHNDPKYWPNPETFDPERFLVNEGKQLISKVESYTPFSYGKRSCPGEHIALVSILQYFTRLMQKFRVLPAEGKIPKYDTVHGLIDIPKDVHLRFVQRE